MPIEYDFDSQYRMSEGILRQSDVQALLMSLIPGATHTARATAQADRNGVDWWVYRGPDSRLGVDVKMRSEDYARKTPAQDDLALETWSVVEQGIVGWTRDVRKQTDYILWIWQDTKRFCLIPFPLLCKAFQANWERWCTLYGPPKQQRTTSEFGCWHSECVFVPRDVIWRTIYIMFGGAGQLTSC